jgi:late competence protein required for DNA uptake (superfamily II DNA/RNA helicase)
MNFLYHWHIKIPQTLAYSKMNSRIYAKKVQSILLKWWKAKHILNKPPVLKFLLNVSQSELKMEPNKILKIAMAYHNYAEFYTAAVFQVSFIKALRTTAPFLFLSVHIDALHNVHISFTV